MNGSASLLGLAGTDSPARPDLAASFREFLERTDSCTEYARPLEAESARPDELLAAIIAVLPSALDAHTRAVIPEAVTLASLADVGRKHRLYGIETSLSWCLGVMRADVVELGRLQVARIAESRGHAVHVPETGPLDPSAVEDALLRMREFTGATRFHCTSWLLGPFLQIALPGSNIAAFARRFRRVDTADSGDGRESVARFVFQKTLAEVLNPGGVTPTTRLEKLVATSLREGYEWSEPVGVLDL